MRQGGKGAGGAVVPDGAAVTPRLPAAREFSATGDQKKGVVLAGQLALCEACGDSFEPNRTGRPRRFCGVCSSPAAAALRWRERNPAQVEAYNADRRAAYEQTRGVA